MTQEKYSLPGVSTAMLV